mmetsp:Transcript_103877/g.294298  ORF Transcript_103877/g.294298 Transcript_103877/m.294298 type:complete len:116 (-) Transcript_103877:150-497(-)
MVASMPLLAAAAPALDLSRRLGCPAAFNRRMALYFIAPFGLAATALGYPQHRHPGVAAGNLGGVAIVVLAATWHRMQARRMACMLTGCSVMLFAQYLGSRIAKERAVGGGCCKEC